MDKKCDRDNVTRYVSQLHRKTCMFINREVAQYDIPPGQLMYLITLYKEDGQNQEALSEKLKIDKGTTARALKKLEAHGLITRVKDEADKRINHVYLTNQGRSIQPKVFDVIDRWNEKISQSLTAEEEVLLENLLKKVCQAIDS